MMNSLQNLPLKYFFLQYKKAKYPVLLVLELFLFLYMFLFVFLFRFLFFRRGMRRRNTMMEGQAADIPATS
jgi:hypothetical protein